MITIDFETEAINGALPPKPVGVSIKLNDEPSEYYSWGHPGYNSSTFDKVKTMLAECIKQPCLFHNASFDVAVLRYWFRLPYPAEIHDTLLLLFLEDPHAATLALKPSAEKFLKMPPEERDVLHEWIVKNVAGSKPRSAGAYISKAPAKLVGPYAEADTDMTYSLYKLLSPRHLGEAYARECKLVPILVENTLQGIDVDISSLEKDYKQYTLALHDANKLIYSKLGRVFNIGSGAELADAISKSNVECVWEYTATGKRSTAKGALERGIRDKDLLTLLNYRGTLATYLETFFVAWLNKSRNGVLHFSWNQTRNSERGGSSFSGTRTGRLSSVPSMLNIPKAPKQFGIIGLPELPTMKTYMLPDEDDKWLSFDYASQELRVLAHFEDGKLMKAYNENPDLDLHQFVADEISTIVGYTFPRQKAKTVAFSILYGSGLDALAEGLGVTRDEAAAIKANYMQAVPGIQDVQRSIKFNSDRGLPIKTFGGRKYYTEPSREIKDKRTGVTRYANFSYKLLNYLIQGSSADITKQAIINYNEIKKDGRWLLSVHDSMEVSGPESEKDLVMQAMTDIKLDCPLTVDFKSGNNYGN